MKICQQITAYSRRLQPGEKNLFKAKMGIHIGGLWLIIQML